MSGEKQDVSRRTNRRAILVGLAGSAGVGTFSAAVSGEKEKNELSSEEQVKLVRDHENEFTNANAIQSVIEELASDLVNVHFDERLNVSSIQPKGNCQPFGNNSVEKYVKSDSAVMSVTVLIRENPITRIQIKMPTDEGKRILTLHPELNEAYVIDKQPDAISIYDADDDDPYSATATGCYLLNVCRNVGWSNSEVELHCCVDESCYFGDVIGTYCEQPEFGTCYDLCEEYVW